MPNIAIIQELKRKYSGRNLEILYIGGRGSMEENLMQRIDVKFGRIFVGKLRRYFSLSNFFDLFKIPVGVIQSYFYIVGFKPDVIFCKGGYASFPVALAGKWAGVPVILHESDVSPGLANKMSSRFATKICISYHDSEKYFAKEKTVYTGTPVRREICSEGSIDKAREATGLTDNLPVLLVMGGSQGASFINNFIWDNLGFLLKKYQIIHICGQGNFTDEDELLVRLSDSEKGLISRYKIYGFVDTELKHFYKFANAIITRAGAVTLAEISAVNKPAILVPLSMRTSRGDQILNSRAFIKEHFAFLMEEEDFSNEAMFEYIEDCISHESEANKKKSNALEEVISIIESV